MPRNGAFSFSATPIQSISVRMNSSLSLALIGPPKITAPQWSPCVVGQRLAEARLADVEVIAVAHEPLADVAGIGILLVQHDQHRLLGLRRVPRAERHLADGAVLADCLGRLALEHCRASRPAWLQQPSDDRNHYSMRHDAHG